MEKFKPAVIPGEAMKKDSADLPSDQPGTPPSMLPRGSGASIAYRRQSAHGAGAALPGVMFLGGFMSDMTGSKAAALAAFCEARGQAFLRFDYQGHGASSSRFEDGTIGIWADDAIAALDALSTGPQILVGSSMGGWIMLLTALARPERIKALIGIAPAPDFTEDLLWPGLAEADRRAILQDGLIRRPSQYDPAGYVITRRLIEDGKQHLLLRGPLRIDRPIRLLHGMKDPDVPWRTSLRLIEALAGTDASLELIKEGDHRLSTPGDLARLTRTVAELSAE
jgi:pimeloyl-ACP methyl ester carboxylesterase